MYAKIGEPCDDLLVIELFVSADRGVCSWKSAVHSEYLYKAVPCGG
jgi:hypothetical protein